LLQFQLEHNKYRAGSLVPCVYKIFPVTGRKVGGGKSSSSRRNSGGRQLVLKPLLEVFHILFPFSLQENHLQKFVGFGKLDMIGTNHIPPQ
jgi:hypothetical protein